MTGDGDTVIATAATPPTAEAANMAKRPGRNTAVIDLINALLKVCERLGAPQTRANRWRQAPSDKSETKSAETAAAHIAISTTRLANSASKYTRQWQQPNSREPGLRDTKKVH